MGADARRLSLAHDGTEVRALFERIFKKAANQTSWEWKYLPPWTNTAYGWVATVGPRVVGHVGAVPLRGQVRGEDVMFFQLGDVMLDPDYRSLDVYLRLNPAGLVDEIRRTYPKAVLYGFTSRKLAVWYSWLAAGKAASTIEPADDWLVRRPPAGAVADGEFEVRPWSWDEAEVDELWPRLRMTVETGLIRDRLYLSWRYGHHPTFTYRLFGAYRHGVPIGWLVTDPPAIRSGFSEELRVHDMLVQPEWRIPVLRHAASALDVGSVVLWMPSLAGAERRPTGWQFIRASLSPEVTREALASGTYFTLGEADEWWS